MNLTDDIPSTKVEIHIGAQAAADVRIAMLIYQSRNSYQCPGLQEQQARNRSTKVEIHISAQAKVYADKAISDLPK